MIRPKLSSPVRFHQRYLALNFARSRRFTLVAVMLVITALLEACGVAGMLPPVSKPAAVERSDSTADGISPMGLQADIFAFADNFLESVAESADWAAFSAGEDFIPEYLRVKTVYATSALALATTADPVHALRDFIVMLRLQRYVWTESPPAYSTEKGTARIALAIRRSESDLMAIATRFLQPASIEALLELTDQWIDSHPGRTYVAFVRFSELGVSQRRQRLEKELDRQGVFAGVSQAALELEELRSATERALFLSNRLPLVLEWQAEGLLHTGLQTTQVREFLDVAQRFSVASENFGDDLRVAVSELGDSIARERAAAITQLAEQVRAERHALLADLRATSGDLLPLTQAMSAAAANIRDAATIVGAMTSDDSGSGSDFTLAEAQVIVADSVLAMESLVTATESMRSLLQIEASSGLLAHSERLLNRLFFMIAALVVLVGAVAVGAVVAVRRMSIGTPKRN